MQDRQEPDRHLIEKIEAEVRDQFDIDIPLVVIPMEFDDREILDVIGESPKFIPELPSDIYEKITGITPDGETVRVVVLDPYFFTLWKKWDEQDVRTLIFHEFGHHLTWDQLTKEDIKEDIFKSMLFELILEALKNKEGVPDRFSATYSLFRHRLKTELMASEAAGLSIHDIKRSIEHQDGESAMMSIPYIDTVKLITKPLHIHPKEVTLNHLYRYIMDFTRDIISNDLIDDIIFMMQFEQMVLSWIDLIQHDEF